MKISPASSSSIFFTLLMQWTVLASQIALWNEADGFYYDVLDLPDQQCPMKVRSLVGWFRCLLFAILEPETLSQFPGETDRMVYSKSSWPEKNVACMETPGVGARRLLAIAYPDKLRRILQKMLDETEFLSPHGIRAVSKVHAEQPYIWRWMDMSISRLRTCRVQHWSIRRQFQLAWTDLASGEFSDYWVTKKFHHYLGMTSKWSVQQGQVNDDSLGSCDWVIWAANAVFLQDESGQRPVYGGTEIQTDPIGVT